MKKLIYMLLNVYRKVRGTFCTFWLKKQLVAYGTHIGAARVPVISRTAKVTVGSHAGFNGFTVSGWGG